MNGNTGAPSGGTDVSSASSSAPASSTAPAGPPSRNGIVRSLKAKRAETPQKGPASPDVAPQNEGPPGAPAPGKQSEGDTANAAAGKGDEKPSDKAKEPESVPLPVFKERLAKEKARREKVETENHSLKGEVAKIRHLFEVAVTENERLMEAQRAAPGFDETRDELHHLKLQQTVKEQLAAKDAEHAQAFAKLQHDSKVHTLAGQLAQEVRAAAAEFPMVSYDEVKAMLRKNPHADIREVARVEHEKRMAYARQHSAPSAATTNLPTTVAKPSGVSRFQPQLNAKGLSQAFKHARSKP
jgi:hypothetical protein